MKNGYNQDEKTRLIEFITGEVRNLGGIFKRVNDHKVIKLSTKEILTKIHTDFHNRTSKAKIDWY